MQGGRIVVRFGAVYGVWQSVVLGVFQILWPGICTGPNHWPSRQKLARRCKYHNDN